MTTAKRTRLGPRQISWSRRWLLTHASVALTRGLVDSHHKGVVNRAVGPRTGCPTCDWPTSQYIDRKILNDIWTILNPRAKSWISTTNWAAMVSGDLHPCDCYGITCDARMNVKRIDLGGNNMVGTIPESIGYFHHLESIKFYGNKVPSHMHLLFPC